MAEKQWYVIYVRSRHEKKVHQLLQKKGIESSLPLVNTVRVWGDRKKKVKIPLFKGYVFVHIDLQLEKFNVLQTNGVVKFIALKKEPSRIPDRQMYWIQKMVNKSDTVQLELEIPVGKKVRVIMGPFTGTEGTVMRKGKRSRLFILVQSIMQAVSIEIKTEYLKII